MIEGSKKESVICTLGRGIARVDRTHDLGQLPRLEELFLSDVVLILSKTQGPESAEATFTSTRRRGLASS